MKQSLCLLLAVALLTGCATSSIESRHRERASAYALLSSEMKTLVDQGQIRRGMSQDAVYIAWGKPSQVLHMEDQRGAVTTWLYQGSYMEETRYWPYRARTPNYDYDIRGYISAEVVFQNGEVTNWRTLPKPPE
ncbi:MAG: hypothetical protein QM813_17630 [Verrucomicrobiota bacterium]